MATESKVQFNLKNVHYAVLTETYSGGAWSETWATPVAVSGAVSLELSAQGDQTDFYADGTKYYSTRANQGYSGSLVLAHIPDTMRTAIWGQALDNTDKVIVEKSSDTVKDFALMFQIDGDESGQLFTFYKCNASRPSVASKTNENSIEVQTTSLDLTISPLLSNGAIFNKTTADCTTAYLASYWSQVELY